MHKPRRFYPIVLTLGVATAIGCFAQNASPPATTTSVLSYIDQTWKTLTRSNAMLATAAVDPKFHALPNGHWPVYVAKEDQISDVKQELLATMNRSDYDKIDVRALPADVHDLHDQGLLFLPHPYVVPGGRFNEMYGWDSYFIQVGLLRDNKVDLAKDMADNFVYEIREYGTILNANRTYYLSRSQPPFLTEMLLGVYKKTHDRKWLEDALPAIDKYYRFWTTAPHLTEETGLSRYYDLGDGPAPEVLSAERNAEGQTHYDLVRLYYQTHTFTDYDVRQYYDKDKGELTPLFYKGDRSMRESGFDPSNRFGPFNIDIIHYDPVCLNSLLYLMEMQTAEIMSILGRTSDVEGWRSRAKARADRINKLMWDAGDGLYYDYNFALKTVRKYPFLTTFYPLWAGFATPEQASQVVKNLPKFERQGGLRTSTYESGNQWDSPFGWAPLELIAVEGLRKYGYTKEADRITIEFLSMVDQQFKTKGYIVEKFDVEHPMADVSMRIHFGYSTNEAGFGWTNAAFTTLYDSLSPQAQQRMLSKVRASQP